MSDETLREAFIEKVKQSIVIPEELKKLITIQPVFDDIAIVISNNTVQSGYIHICFKCTPEWQKEGAIAINSTCNIPYALTSGGFIPWEGAVYLINNWLEDTKRYIIAYWDTYMDLNMLCSEIVNNIEIPESLQDYVFVGAFLDYVGILFNDLPKDEIESVYKPEGEFISINLKASNAYGEYDEPLLSVDVDWSEGTIHPDVMKQRRSWLEVVNIINTWFKDNEDELIRVIKV